METKLIVREKNVCVLQNKQLGLTVEAALVETEDGIDFAVPNVRFEVRIGVRTVFEGTSGPETGVFRAEKIPITINELVSGIDIVASYNDEDSTAKILEPFDFKEILEGINLSEFMREILEKTHSKRVAEKAQAEAARKADEKKRELAREQTETHLKILKARDYFDGYVQEHGRLLQDVPVLVNRTHEPCILDYRVISGNREYPDKGLHFASSCYDHLNALLADNHLAREVAVNITRRGFGIILCSYYNFGAAIYPDRAFSYITKFAELPWGRDLFIEFVRSKATRRFILEESRHFATQVWAADVFMEAARLDPALVMELVPHYQYYPWAEEVVRAAGSIDAKVVIENFKSYKYQPWAEGIKATCAGMARLQREREMRERQMKEEAKERVRRDKERTERERQEKIERQARETCKKRRAEALRKRILKEKLDKFVSTPEYPLNTCRGILDNNCELLFSPENLDVVRQFLPRIVRAQPVLSVYIAFIHKPAAYQMNWSNEIIAALTACDFAPFLQALPNEINASLTAIRDLLEVMAKGGIVDFMLMEVLRRHSGVLLNQDYSYTGLYRIYNILNEGSGTWHGIKKFVRGIFSF